MPAMRCFSWFVMLLIVLASGCGKSNPAKAGVAGAAGMAEGNEEQSRFDRLAAGQLDDGDRAAEARGWLDTKNTSNVLWKISRSQTLKYVNDLYQAGAVKVYVIYAPKDQTIPVNVSAELFLELPQDAATRGRVIKAYDRIEKDIWGPDHDPAKDEGQKYLHLSMDP
jgi:hypothetical protein